MSKILNQILLVTIIKCMILKMNTVIRENPIITHKLCVKMMVNAEVLGGAVKYLFKIRFISSPWLCVWNIVSSQ